MLESGKSLFCCVLIDRVSASESFDLNGLESVVELSVEDSTVSNCSDPEASTRSRRETVLRTFLVVVEALLVCIGSLVVREWDPVSEGSFILQVAGEAGSTGWSKYSRREMDR